MTNSWDERKENIDCTPQDIATGCSSRDSTLGAGSYGEKHFQHNHSLFLPRGRGVSLGYGPATLAGMYVVQRGGGLGVCCCFWLGDVSFLVSHPPSSAIVRSVALWVSPMWCQLNVAALPENLWVQSIYY